MKHILVLFLWALLGLNQAEALPITYSAVLSGAAENPPTGSLGTGVATVTYDDLAHTLRVEVSFADLDGNVIAAHIHCCTTPPGNVGVATTTPSFPGFPSGLSGIYDQTFDLTQASSFNGTFITNNGGTPASAEATLAAGLAAGRAYFNIHTQAFGGGEIRGFLTVPELDAASGTAAIALLSGMLALGSERRRRGHSPQGTLGG